MCTHIISCVIIISRWTLNFGPGFRILGLVAASENSVQKCKSVTIMILIKFFVVFTDGNFSLGFSATYWQQEFLLSVFDQSRRHRRRSFVGCECVHLIELMKVIKRCSLSPVRWITVTSARIVYVKPASSFQLSHLMVLTMFIDRQKLILYSLVGALWSLREENLRLATLSHWRITNWQIIE